MGSRFWPNSLGGQTCSDLADSVASGLRDWSCIVNGVGARSAVLKTVCELCEPQEGSLARVFY